MWTLFCLQHEFGIYGGPAGSHILAFLRELRMPVVTTLHTVLREPNMEQRRVMQELISLSARVVVISERGQQMLQDIYRAPPGKIDLIAHGIPDVGFVDPNIFQRPVRCGRANCPADIWPAFAEQGNRVCAERSAGYSGGVPAFPERVAVQLSDQFPCGRA